MGSQPIQILREAVCLGGNRECILIRGRQARGEGYIASFDRLRAAAGDDPKEVARARSEPVMAEAGGRQRAAPLTRKEQICEHEAAVTGEGGHNSPQLSFLASLQLLVMLLS